MFKVICRFAFSVLLLTTVAEKAHAIAMIDTQSTWDGTSTVLSFGETNTATYGQTFTPTGAETQLDSFTFLINDLENPDTIEFQAFVYEWDSTTNTITGSTLFSSGNLSTTADGDAGVFETFTINTGGTSLTAGTQYVAFFSASNLFDGSIGTGEFAFSQLVDPYAGGSFVFSNNGSNFADLFSTGWSGCNVPLSCFVDPNSSNGDLAFTMNFSEGVVVAVPEPNTLALFGIGLAGVGVLLRRRRKSAFV